MVLLNHSKFLVCWYSSLKKERNISTNSQIDLLDMRRYFVSFVRMMIRTFVYTFVLTHRTLFPPRVAFCLAGAILFDVLDEPIPRNS